MEVGSGYMGYGPQKDAVEIPSVEIAALFSSSLPLDFARGPCPLALRKLFGTHPHISLKEKE